MAKSKLTPELQKEICDLIAQGNFVVDACALVGISKETYYRWIETNNDFCDAIKAAQAQCKQERIERLKKAAVSGSWQADAWFLERAFPDQFGKRQIEITGKDSKPIEVNHNVKFNSEQSERIRQILRTGIDSGIATSMGSDGGKDTLDDKGTN